MPRLSDSMEEGTILKWLKSDGDEVKRGEELVEIETDKANMTYEADQEGVLKIVAQEGDTLPVGETIAQIGEGGGGESSAAAPAEERGAGAAAARRRKRSSASSSPSRSRPRSSEPERERATGTAASRRRRSRAGWRRSSASSSPRCRAPGPAAGSSSPTWRPPRGTASRRQQAPAEEEQETAPEPVASGDGGSGRGATTTEDLSRLQKTIARRMAESKATAPEFVITCEVDMQAAVDFRKQLKAASGEAPAPSFNDFVVKASALALEGVPARQRRLPRRQVRALLARQRRDRRRRPGHADRAHDLRRRQQVARADLARRARAWPSGCAQARSRRPSSRAGRSACPTSACSGSSASRR